MENYKIDSPFQKTEFIRISMVRWTIQNRKYKGSLMRLSIITFVFFVFVFLTFLGDNPSYGLLTFGMSSFFLTLFLIYGRVITKVRYHKTILQTADKFEELNMDCSYDFSDDSVKYWDKEKHFDFKWSVFSSYSIYKNYLILSINDSIISFYIFEKKEDDQNEYNRILEFAKLKLNYKELK
jgi:hypothetical protein